MSPSEIGDVFDEESLAHWSRIFRERLYNKSAPPSKKNLAICLDLWASRRPAESQKLSSYEHCSPKTRIDISEALFGHIKCLTA